MPFGGGTGPAVALAVGENVLVVKTLFNGQRQTYRVTVTRQAAQQQQQQQRTEPLTAAFGNVPSEHDGTAFTFDLTLSEAPGAGNLPVAASFKVAPGKASVSGSGTRYTVTVTPKAANAWKDVTVTLAGGRACGEAGAICTADGRSLTNTSSATVGGPVRIRVAGARAKEGKDESLDFAVTLNRAADHAVSVDYATEDGTAAAGADYTATSGTLVFTAGETAKTVSVPLLDDAVDEGKETMRLKLSNPQGAYLRNVHRQAKGVIRNADPLPKAYLGHFGRRAASDAIAAVTARFETPRGAGSHLTFAGQRLDVSGAGLGQTVAGLARAFGAEEATPGDDPWNDPASAPGRAMSGRELLTGTSFRAVVDQGTGAQLTSWGQGASVSHFSGAASGVSLSGEAATGTLGMDYERGRMLAGFALTHSLGAGTAHGAGETYALGSTVTTVLPYARLALTERLSAWTLAGTGSGGLTLDAAAQRHRTDLSMTLAAAGMRGDLVPPTEAGGLALAVKADAFWVRTESASARTPGVGRLAAARADATRLRAVLDGKRTFALASGRTLAPSLALGFRHDGGDAGTGTGMELGAGVGYTDPSRGLDMALRVYGLAAHVRGRPPRMGRVGVGQSGAGRLGAGAVDVAHAVVGRGPGGCAAAVDAAGRARAGGERRGGHTVEPSGHGARLRAAGVRRRVHGHAQRRVRAVGDGAGLAPRLAPDPVRVGRYRLRGEPRRDPARGCERRRRARGDAPRRAPLVSDAARGYGHVRGCTFREPGTRGRAPIPPRRCRNPPPCSTVY